MPDSGAATSQERWAVGKVVNGADSERASQASRHGVAHAPEKPPVLILQMW